MLINANEREKKKYVINNRLRVQNKPNVPTGTAFADKTTRAYCNLFLPIHTEWLVVGRPNYWSD